MADPTDSTAKVPHVLGDLYDVDAEAPPVANAHLIWNAATGEWTVKAPGAAIPDTTDGLVATVQAEVNKVKAALRTAGIIA